MAETKQVHVSSIKTGNYLIIDGAACVAKRIDISRPGKHGHAKHRIEAVNLIDKTKKIIVRPAHDKIDVPIVEKKTAQVLSVMEDKVNVMDVETYETLDLELPEEFKGKVKEGDNILYWIIMDDKILKEIK